MLHCPNDGTLMEWIDVPWHSGMSYLGCETCDTLWEYTYCSVTGSNSGMTPSHQTFSQYKELHKEKEGEVTGIPTSTFPEDLQSLWDNTAEKFSCDLLSCDVAIDICDPHEDAVSVEIEHPETGVRKYLWFCCEKHKKAAFEHWPILEKQQVRFF